MEDQPAAIGDAWPAWKCKQGSDIHGCARPATRRVRFPESAMTVSSALHGNPLAILSQRQLQTLLHCCGVGCCAAAASSAASAASAAGEDMA